VYLMELPVHRSQLRDVGKMVLNFRGIWKRGNFLTNRASTAFPRGASVHEDLVHELLYLCVCVCVCVCMYVRMYVYMHVYMHVYRNVEGKVFYRYGIA